MQTTSPAHCSVPLPRLPPVDTLGHATPRAAGAVTEDARKQKQPRSKNTVSAKRKADSPLQNYAEKRKEEVTPEGVFMQIIPGAQKRTKRQPSAQSQGGYEW